MPVARAKALLQDLARLAAAVEDGLLVMMLGVLIGLAGLQIVLRNLLQTGLSWSDPLVKVLVLWVALLGAMAATRDDNHITVDILSKLLPQRLKVLARLITDGFTACVCLVLAYCGARLVLLDWQDGVIAFASVPAWLCELIIPLGFGIIALRYGLCCALRLGQLVEAGKPPPAAGP